MKRSGKVSCLTSLLFVLSAFSAVASDVAAPAAQSTPPSVKNESVKPEVQTDSATNQDVVPEHPISAQQFMVRVEKPDDYGISIMIDSKIIMKSKKGDIITGYVNIYNYETGELFKKIELDSAKALNSGYELDNHLSGPLLLVNIPVKGRYVIIPYIQSKNKKINAYSLHFARAVPTKSLWN
ncbi:hypothetical protein AB6859_17860 [Rahnella inusitata]|uniref:hypothetical protein n=1 Tax=Rahnella inusitata TaxID=58169 RepID=UPI0039BE4F7F